MANSTYPVGAASRAGQRQMLLLALTRALAVLAATSSLIGLLTTGGPGRQVVQTARGATVTLYGAGLYAADTWLIGSGNRGQDLAILIFELPVLLLLLVLGWYSRNGPVAPAVLAGVLGFFAYYYLAGLRHRAEPALPALRRDCKSCRIRAGPCRIATERVRSRCSPAGTARTSGTCGLSHRRRSRSHSPGCPE